MRTPIYVKMDAPEQLLLSDGVCCQLGIITYHPEVDLEVCLGAIFGNYE